MGTGAKKPAIEQAADDDTAIDLWCWVIDGFQTTNGRMHAAIKCAFSLNAVEAETMLHLGAEPTQRASMATLARAVSFTSGGFTKIADKLTQRGLAARVACAEDRRVTYFQLTPAGIEIAAELRRLVADISRSEFIDVLGPELASLVAEAMHVLHKAKRQSGP
jgi:DNA-binding MarR family transcriptional regulator